MKIQDKVIVVTGGASGIGRGLCRRFAADGAKGVVVSDYNGEEAAKVAEEIGGLAVTADVGKEADVQRLVEFATNCYGPIDLFCLNAGISSPGGAEAPDSDWWRCWDVLMAHVYAAQAVLLSMIKRGGGCLLQTGSAGGVLTTLGSAPYAISKHASMAFCGMAFDHPCPPWYQSQLPLSFWSQDWNAF